jgi:hypothetical protein
MFFRTTMARVGSLPILSPRARLRRPELSSRCPCLSSQRALRVLAQSPAVEASAPAQPRLFLHLQLLTLGEPSFAAELSHAACACALRPTRSERALKDERGCLGRGHALFARLEAEVVSEGRALNDGRVFAGHELMQIVRVSEGDSQPAFGSQDLAICEREKVVCKTANCLQRDPAIRVLRHWSRESDYNRSVARKLRWMRVLTPRHDLAGPSCCGLVVEPVPSVPGWWSRRQRRGNRCHQVLNPTRRTGCGSQALCTFCSCQRLVR